jgi:hypothetical protein
MLIAAWNPGTLSNPYSFIDNRPVESVDPVGFIRWIRFPWYFILPVEDMTRAAATSNYSLWSTGCEIAQGCFDSFGL